MSVLRDNFLIVLSLSGIRAMTIGLDGYLSPLQFRVIRVAITAGWQVPQQGRGLTRSRPLFRAHVTCGNGYKKGRTQHVEGRRA